MRRAAAPSAVALLALPFLVAAAPTTRPAAPARPAVVESSGAGRARAAQALSRKLPAIKLNQVQLTDAIDFVRDVSDANIHVNWRALEQIGVARDTAVSLQLSEVPVRRVLRSLLDETGAGQQLTYYVDEGVIEVTTKEIADAQLITKVYAVEDLVMEVPNFGDAPTFNLQNQTNQASGAGGGGSGSQTLFGSNGSGTGQAEPQQTKSQRADTLVKLIMETVRPDVWRENGGTSSVRYFNGHLIVTAPRSVHEMISGKQP
jgi:hypothetical protein